MSIGFLLFPGLAALSHLGTNRISIETFFYIIISFFSFCIGYFLSKSIKTHKQYKITSPNYKIITLFSLFLLIFSLSLLPKALSLMNLSSWDNSFDFLRENSSRLFGSTALAIVYEVVLLPCSWIIFILTMNGLLNGDKKAVFPLIIDVATVLIFAICFAARANLVRFLFYIAFLFLSNSSIKEGLKRILSFFKNHLIISICVILALVGFTFFLTNSRDTSSGRTFFDNLYIYYSCPFKLFDFYVKNDDISLIGSSYLYGGAMLGSIVNLFFIFLTFAFGFEYSGTDYAITQITANNYSIGSGISMNAATTAMYPFMRDFGLLGLVIGFFIWGLLSGTIEKKNQINPKDTRTKVIYVFLLYVVFKLSMSYEALTPSFAFAILFIFMFTKKGKMNHEIY